MNMYAVILLADEEEPGAAVKILRGLDPSVYEHYAQRGLYFVRFGGTAQQLAERMGFGTGRGPHPLRGVVLGVSQYFGFANRDLWNWMGSS